MKVKINKYGNVVTVELEAALTPEGDASGGNGLDYACANARAACDAVGRLLAHLVEAKSLTLDDARAIAGHYMPCEPVVERSPIGGFNAGPYGDAYDV